MRILGQFDTDGNYMPYASSMTCHVFGRTLRDDDGFVLAVKDKYGDWVSPTMKRLGLKSVIKVDWSPTNGDAKP